MILRRAAGTLVFLLILACNGGGTVVSITVPTGAGGEAPAAEQVLVILPYDRDSVVAALGAPYLGTRPDTLPMARLFDSLRTAYETYTAAAGGARTTARARLEAMRAASEGRLAALRAAERAWRDTAYRTYDSVTFALTKRLARDPFADTTDQHGVARIAPSRSGPWWVTATAWDAADPNAEWYWNLPLTGDTVRLSAANARHRRRY